MHRRVVKGAVAVLLFLVLTSCSGEADSVQPAQQPSAPPVTVETGGMVLPGAPTAAALTSPAEAAGVQGVAADSAEAAVEVPILAVGADVVARVPMPVFAEPDLQAPRFSQYAAGSRFTVVEPDGDFAAYPVEVQGRRWYRVRAEDGLVGWVPDPS